MIPRWSELTIAVKLIVGTVALFVIALLAWAVVHMLTAKPKAEAKLGQNTTAAAIGSGKDAVTTVGARAETDSDTDRKVGDANAKVDAAPDAAAADAAGRDGLCRVAGGSFCQHPVQQPHP